MYFFTKIYQSLKAIISLTGASGSIVAIVYGVLQLQTGGTPFIIGGSLCLANSLFNIVELAKVNFDIKKQIKELENNISHFVNENTKLAESNVKIRENIDAQTSENNRLQSLVKKSEMHISKLENFQKQILKTKNCIENEAAKLQNENVQLKELTHQLEELKDDYKIENDQLYQTINDLRNQVVSIESLKDSISSENNKLQDNNKELMSQLEKQQQIIIESKKLIQNLATFGDQFTNFHTALGNDIDSLNNTNQDLDNTSTVLKNLVDKLKDQEFDKLDKNNDGVITLEEFEEGLREQ